MAEVYIDEVAREGGHTSRDVNVTNRQIYEKWKPAIMKATEYAVAKYSVANKGYAKGSIRFYENNGRLYATGKGPLAQLANEFITKYKPKPTSYRRSQPVRRQQTYSSGGDYSFVIALSLPFIAMLLLAMLGAR